MKEKKMIILMIVLLILITGCGNKESELNNNDIIGIRNGYPIEVPENAQINVFPQDNILELRSVCSYGDSTERTMIFEFGNEEDGITKSDWNWAFTRGDMVFLDEENKNIMDCNIKEEKTHTYLVVNYSAADEATKLDILGRDHTYCVSLGENVCIVKDILRCECNGEWGIKRLIQDYDEPNKIWKEVNTLFFEEVKTAIE